MGEGEEELYIQRAPACAELIRQPESGTSQVGREDLGDRADNVGPPVGVQGAREIFLASGPAPSAAAEQAKARADRPP
jgi:hypothetical protein